MLAIFTYRLWETTGDMVAKADTAAEGQRTVMAAQQSAMENQVTAMQAIADSVAESADAARAAVGFSQRMLTAAHPPVIEIVGLMIGRQVDGPPLIVFALHNAGRSDATVRACITNDKIRGSRGGAGAREHPELVGRVIRKYDSEPVQHACLQLTNDALFSTESPLVAEFSVIVLYEDGDGAPLHATPRYVWVRGDNRLVLIPDNHE